MRIFKKILLKRQNKIKFIEDFRKFTDLASKDKRFFIKEADLFPCLDDATDITNFDAHYIYHTAWAARRIAARMPVLHVDISSYLYFSTLLSAFVPVDFYDYRPASIKLNGLSTKRNDLTALNLQDGSIKSLSCMHTVEHVGLGRYGDPVDPKADLVAMGELRRVLAPGGRLYFVVPVGKPRVCFNAHRIYSFRQIVDFFNDLSLVEFSLIPDDAETAGIIEDATEEKADNQNYGCGCFIFEKP